MASIAAAVVAASLAMATASFAAAAEQRPPQRALGAKPAPRPVAGARSIPETWAEPKAKTRARPVPGRASGKTGARPALQSSRKPAPKPALKPAVKPVFRPAAQAAAGLAAVPPMARAAPVARPDPRGAAAATPVRSRRAALAVPASAATAWRFDAATSSASGPDSTRWPVAVDAMANRMAVFWGREVLLGVGARGWTGDVQARPQRWGLRVTLRVALPP